MEHREITIKDIEQIIPFSRGSTEIFLTGQWSSGKPAWVERSSPCRRACPAGNDIARAFSFASVGRMDDALRVFREDNPLPGVCGRVCYHPCEGECNRAELDEAINIRGFERFCADHGRPEQWVAPKARKERVAVVGSGPAGLSAAYHLARLGYGVTVFEALPEPGGMLMYGIPEYRLPKAVLRREIGYIRKQGVEIRTGTRVAAEGHGGLSLSRIRRDYQAVLVAVGSQKGLRLGLQEERLPNVTEGTEFLRGVALGEREGVGRRVVVVGGGNTAMDCARSARRLGAVDVRIVCPEMPALPEEVAAAEHEGIRIDLPAGVKRLIAKEGRISGVEAIRMEEPPRPGVLPDAIPGTEFTLACDAVIVAIGQASDTAFLGGSGVALGERGVVETVGASGTTCVPGLFAAGDGAGARAFVADAIGSGKMAALSIFCFLDGRDPQKEYESLRIGDRQSFSFQHLIDPAGYAVDLKDVVTYERLNTICVPYGRRNDNPERADGGKRTASFKEVASGVAPGRMEAEIERCFKCGTCTGCDLCFFLCPDISIIKAAASGYEVKADYCKGCGVCASACPRHVIEMGGHP